MIRPILFQFVIFTICIPNAFAHHEFNAEFDVNAPVDLKGKITKVEWVNPHTWLHMRVERQGQPPQDWMIEAGSPNVLLRRGVDRSVLKVGIDIEVRGYRAKDRDCTPACKASGRDITLANGKKLFVGSSGTGAPRDGADPSEPSLADPKKSP
jgi:hypothetical protein